MRRFDTGWRRTGRMWAGLGLLALGCGVSGGGRSDEENALNDAWALFHQQRWDDALVAFQNLVDDDQAVGEAFGGVGWSRLHLLMPSQAGIAFRNSLVSDEGNLDSRAGEAFALRDSGGDSGRLLSQARSVLFAEPTWRFDHETSVDWMDLQILMAQTFFLRQQFDSSLYRCRRVDPAVAVDRADSASWQGAASFELALFDELDRLTRLVGE